VPGAPRRGTCRQRPPANATAEAERRQLTVTLLRSTRTDQIANDDEAAGDADPHVQRLGCCEPADRVDDRQPGAGRALGIVLMRLGIAEIYQHAVAHILGDKPAKAADGVGDAAVVRTDDLAQILGIEAGGQRRRADQVAERGACAPGMSVTRLYTRVIASRGPVGPGPGVRCTVA